MCGTIPDKVQTLFRAPVEGWGHGNMVTATPPGQVTGQKVSGCKQANRFARFSKLGRQFTKPGTHFNGCVHMGTVFSVLYVYCFFFYFPSWRILITSLCLKIWWLVEYCTQIEVKPMGMMTKITQNKRHFVSMFDLIHPCSATILSYTSLCPPPLTPTFLLFPILCFSNWCLHQW